MKTITKMKNSFATGEYSSIILFSMINPFHTLFILCKHLTVLAAKVVLFFAEKYLFFVYVII